MLRLTLIACLLAGLASEAPAADDADLFAPVRKQMDERIAAAKKLADAGIATPERVYLLLDSGRIQEAQSLLPALTGDPREVAVARANARLVVQDFTAARPLVDEISARPDPTDAERRVLFAWLFKVNDMAKVDEMTRGSSLEPGTTAPVPDLLAAGQLAYELMNYDRAEACYQRVLERTAAGAADGRIVDITTYMTGSGDASPAAHATVAARADALKGLGLVAYKRRDYDGSLVKLRESIAANVTPDNLNALCETLIRLGRTDDAITATEWAIRFNPWFTASQYMLGNGYARKNYTELRAAYPAAFSDASGARELAAADTLLAHGDRDGARAAYEATRRSHPGRVDPLARLASLDFEDGQFDASRDLCFAALAICPEYGRAHATLAKALESQRFLVDVHRPEYERKFAEAPMPDVPGIETFVVNWHSLSPRHQKRVALSVAPWKRFIPVLVAGGSTYYIKPLYMLLSETPGQETLRDQRINYDSRLWDDVRGCGGYHTVTGIEDVERTIFDQYNTVLHELTHQVHSVLTADQGRVIQDLYVKAKARDDATKNGYLSRYAGGSVFEYFAEGANALESPRRDAYDTREVVRDRLDTIDPDLRKLVEKLFAQTDVSASYPVAYVNAGGDWIERGEVDPALAYYEKALAADPNEENALQSLVYAQMLRNDGPKALAAVDRALAAHPDAGSIVTTCAEALWHSGRGIDAALDLLQKSREKVRPEDRHVLDLALGRYHWMVGDAPAAIAAYDSVLAYQSDNPEALWGRASSLALAKRWDDAFKVYDDAVRLRTGVVDLRCDYARDLLLAGRTAPAEAQLAEAVLLDAQNPTAEALRGWASLAEGKLDEARAHLGKSEEWGPWEDLTPIVMGRVAQASGDAAGALAAVAPIQERIAKNSPPEYVYRETLSQWRSVHELPAIEREMLKELTKP